MPRPAILDPRSLTLRLVLIAGVWIVGALTAGGVILSMAFRDYAIRDTEERLTQTLDTLVGVADLQPDGRFEFARQLSDERFREPYSGYYWQIVSRGRPPSLSRSLWDQRLDPQWQKPAAADAFRIQTGPDGQRVKVAVRDVTLPGSDRTFRFMVAADTADVQRDIHRFDTLIAQSLGLLGLGLLAAVGIQVAVGLRPLRRIRTGLADIRSGRAKRLENAFPPEITPLVDELNALLSHNETIVERARTHAGNLAHALKTPLSVLSNEADEADGALADTVRRQTDAMQRHVDHHLRRARATGAGLGAVTVLDRSVASLVRAMDKIYRDRALELSCDLEDGLQVASTQQDLEDVVGNLLDNACKWAQRRVCLSAARVPGPRRDMIRLTVEDDGPGVSAADRARLFDRGRRLDESVPGTGLGLAITQDITELTGGEIHLAASDMGGLKVIVDLPEAA